MPDKRLNVSEARKRFSRLVAGVGQGGTAVTITQHGRERAILVGIREYQELSQKARAFERSRQKPKPFTLKGSLQLCCSPEELLKEILKIRTLWGESVYRARKSWHVR